MARPFALLLAVMLLLPLKAKGQLLLCNSFTTLGADFANSLATAPTNNVGVTDSAFHADCSTRSPRSYCDLLTDNRALLNMRLNTPPADIATAYVDYRVQIDGKAAGLDFSSRLSSTKTTWYTVQFEKPTMTCLSATLCNSGLYALQPKFFTVPFTFASDTLIASGTRQAPDIVLDTSGLRKATDARFLRVAASSSRAGGDAAFWTNGCTPPQFTVRVKFALTSEVAAGYSVTTTNLDKRIACYSRTISIVAVGDSGTTMNCQFPYSIRALRHMLLPDATTPDAAQKRLAVIQTMRSEKFAVDTTGSGGWVFFSESQANNILGCIAPVSGVGGKWDGTSALGPGMCTPCATKPISSHTQLRACNRTLLVDQIDPLTGNPPDCCYSCTSGYMLDPITSLTCVPECKRNTQYNLLTAGAACMTCPAGQFSNGGADRCSTCQQRGVWNAKVVAAKGCVTCDSNRFVASLDLCVPCPVNQFVPTAGGTACTTCAAFTNDQAYFLATAASTNGSTAMAACQPCGPGTFMLTQTTSCQTCPIGSYTAGSASTTCHTCAIGYQSTPNRTSCAPCPSIDRALRPYSQYYEPGCNLRCNTTVSYAYGTAYALGGCRACADLVLPIGTYADPSACARPLPCTNAPAAKGAYYTGAAPRGSTTCPFSCIPGYALSAGACTPCSRAGFNPDLHVDVAGCAFDCKPGLYRDGTLLCNKKCTVLMEAITAVPPLIHLRVRDYSSSVGRPSYVIGHCGSDDTVPRSPYPFLRKAWWAYLRDYTSATCGNALLETGETCDDGNTQLGDGCSDACQVETGEYWDCDLIGQPCLRNCGWQAQATDQWGISLRGFLLPACAGGGSCRCGNMTYFGVTQQVEVGKRRAWMLQHFATCNCDGNSMRTVPYEQCTLANRGCRECKAGEYHDDRLGQCVACGSQCQAGYYYYHGYACVPQFSSSYNILHMDTLSLTQQQAYIGCDECTPPSGGASNLRWLSNIIDGGSACKYMCYRDTTGESTANNSFCSVAALDADGSCPGLCLSCASRLAALRSDYTTGVSNGWTTYNGYYIDQCRDVEGHTWAPCDLSAKPDYAEWTSGSSIVGDRTGCQWRCPPSITWDYHKTCLRCTPVIVPFACPSGQTMQYCDVLSRYQTCVPCEGPTPSPMQVWTTSAADAFQACVPDCEPGVSWSPTTTTNMAQLQCQPCAHMACRLGELFTRCTPRQDATCQPCADTAYGALALNKEYIAPGLCTPQCVSGYYATSTSLPCLKCLPVGGEPCALGQNQTSYCLDALTERKSAPLCQSCPQQLVTGGPYRTWAGRSSTTPPCAVACVEGYVLVNGTDCVPCDSGLCAYGQMGICTSYPPVTYLNCRNCTSAFLPFEEFVQPGSCATRCRAGYAYDLYRQCAPIVPVAAPTTTPVSNTANEAAVHIYPTRGLKHSGMSDHG